MRNRTSIGSELLPGTLELLILKTLTRGPAHGYAIARQLERGSGDVLQVFEAEMAKPQNSDRASTERARGVADESEELLSMEALATPTPAAARPAAASAPAPMSVPTIEFVPVATVTPEPVAKTPEPVAKATPAAATLRDSHRK